MHIDSLEKENLPGIKKNKRTIRAKKAVQMPYSPLRTCLALD